MAELMCAETATAEFGRLLKSGYYKKDRSVNTAEDYSVNKEKRDMEAALEYADTEEFREFCVKEGFVNV